MQSHRSLFDIMNSDMPEAGKLSSMKEAMKAGVMTDQDLCLKDDKGLEPIHIAASRGYVEIIRFLKDKVPVDTQTQNEDGDTPLHLAIKGAHPGICRLLIDSGANPHLINKINKKGCTPIHTTLQKPCINNEDECIEIANLLIKQKVNVNTPQKKDGKTPLMLAMKFSDELDSRQIIQALIKAGADVNAVDNNGNTPLHHAASDRNYRAMVCLIRNGALKNTKNKAGDFPLNSLDIDGNFGMNMDFDGKMDFDLTFALYFDDDYSNEIFFNSEFISEDYRYYQHQRREICVRTLINSPDEKLETRWDEMRRNYPRIFIKSEKERSIALIREYQPIQKEIDIFAIQEIEEAVCLLMGHNIYKPSEPNTSYMFFNKKISFYENFPKYFFGRDMPHDLKTRTNLKTLTISFLLPNLPLNIIDNIIKALQWIISETLQQRTISRPLQDANYKDWNNRILFFHRLNNLAKTKTAETVTLEQSEVKHHSVLTKRT